MVNEFSADSPKSFSHQAKEISFLRHQYFPSKLEERYEAQDKLDKEPEITYEKSKSI